MSTEPCWILVADGAAYEPYDGIAHYATEEEARKAGSEAGPAYEPRQEPTVCLTGPDCHECECPFNEWAECTVHFDATTYDTDIESWDWRKVDGHWLCGDCDCEHLATKEATR